MNDVSLSGRSHIGGKPVRGAEFRDPAGNDELASCDNADRLTVDFATRLLAECIQTLRTDGGDLQAGRDHVRALTAGDRETLLLALRRAAYGDRLDLLVTCPDVTCGAIMDAALTVSDLLHGTVMSPADRDIDLTGVRPVTGDDLHAVAALALDDPEAAVRRLAARCSGRDDDGTTLTTDELAAIENTLEALDPHAEHELVLRCPECDLAFTSAIDAGELLRQEMTASIAELDLSVHLMASTYHWRERDIMALPIVRRRRYLRVLSDALATPVGH
ncbi:hypothetical protein [Mycolicibacterium bacteremicum]|uniref:Uncharacterized protein n=1 Tax=Mycolicibacterium bacteremicum TaxID=564198 RepID=A0A1W9Z4N1_MYCBA|nr:hypothetical protein [Mycolicibacterium bacteremicum]MCV7433718.1 hypothetical protein [Mycolicibacterium bacteremicum]ORA07243.1 hypothetical protein BST17_01915 [Mycolicibacterium bacteremicum]